MFTRFFNSLPRWGKGRTLLAPLSGTVKSLSEVKDPTFSSGALGDGVAVVPNGNRVVAPANGQVTAIFPTGHAVALHTEDDLDVLIHVGIDTYKLQGRHFTVCVQVGDTVQRGDVLIEFDREAIANEGYDLVAPILICNAAEFSSIKGKVGNNVDELDTLIAARPR